MTEPRTEAGKRLLAVWLEGRTHPPSARRQRDFEELVLAIEAEARAAALVEARDALVDPASRYRLAALDRAAAGANPWAMSSGRLIGDRDDAALDRAAAGDETHE